jgi:tol-pal system protein YbgF
MRRCRSLWLLLVVLGGIASPGTGHARRSPDNDLTLELLDRVERLEAEVRQMRGELELQRHQLELLQQDRALTGPPSYPPEGGATAPGGPPPAPERSMGSSGQPGAVQPPPASVQPPAPPDRAASAQSPTAAARTEQADFDAALGELREGRYSEAVAGFQRFLVAYPASGLAGDAQYWLGEAHYLGRNYDAAKEAFINMGLRHPQSARLPDALLKLGYLYGEQGDDDRAREVLRKLVEVYPNTQAASLAERRLQSLR